MTEEDIKKITKIRKIPFKNATFVRFLKEEKLLSQYINAINDNTPRVMNYQLDTANVKDYMLRFVNRENFILDAFPGRTYRGEYEIDWFVVNNKWQEKRLLKSLNIN